MLCKGHLDAVSEGGIQLPTNSCSTFLDAPGDRAAGKGLGCVTEDELRPAQAPAARWHPMFRQLNTYGVSTDSFFTYQYSLV